MTEKLIKLIITCEKCGESPDKCPYCGAPMSFVFTKKEIKRIYQGFKYPHLREQASTS